MSRFATLFGTSPLSRRPAASRRARGVSSRGSTLPAVLGITAVLGIVAATSLTVARGGTVNVENKSWSDVKGAYRK